MIAQEWVSGNGTILEVTRSISPFIEINYIALIYYCFLASTLTYRRVSSTERQLNKTLWIIHDKYFSRIVSRSKMEQ